jgi:hypothetical protein
MNASVAQRALGIFAARLAVLAALLDKAEAQCLAEGRDPAALVAARLAPDMHSFPWQIVFACNQARQFVDWCGGEPYAEVDASGFDWEAGKEHVLLARAAVDVAIAQELSCPAAERRIDLPAIGAYLELPAERYVDDWLMPNFYFHLSMAYALLRVNGIEVGKADYMAFLLPDLKTVG